MTLACCACKLNFDISVRKTTCKIFYWKTLELLAGRAVTQYLSYNIDY